MPAPRQVHIAGWDKPVDITGNAEILKLPKTAFFSSTKYPAQAVMPCFEWAENARNGGICVISGFHSLLEENIRDLLLMGKQPLIWAIARENYTKPPSWTEQALKDNRLLIISTTDDKRPSSKATDIRNRFILSVADNIVIGYAMPNGKIDSILHTAKNPVQYLSK